MLDILVSKSGPNKMLIQIGQKGILLKFLLNGNPYSPIDWWLSKNPEDFITAINEICLKKKTVSFQEEERGVQVKGVIAFNPKEPKLSYQLSINFLKDREDVNLEINLSHEEICSILYIINSYWK